MDNKYNLIYPTYNCYIKHSLSLIYPLTCTRNTTNRLLIANFNSSINIGNTQYTIGIDNIQTPITLSSLQLSIITLNNLYYSIENVTTTYILSATKINNIKVLPYSYTTYAITSYAFTITNTNILGTNIATYI